MAGPPLSLHRRPVTDPTSPPSRTSGLRTGNLAEQKGVGDHLELAVAKWPVSPPPSACLIFFSLPLPTPLPPLCSFVICLPATPLPVPFPASTKRPRCDARIGRLYACLLFSLKRDTTSVRQDRRLRERKADESKILVQRLVGGRSFPFATPFEFPCAPSGRRVLLPALRHPVAASIASQDHAHGSPRPRPDSRRAHCGPDPPRPTQAPPRGPLRPP